MSRRPGSLAELRTQAIAGSDELISLMGVGRTLGIDVPADDDEIRKPLVRIGQFDIAGLSDDAHRLASAHRVVAEQLHCLPEQQVRLDDGWSSASGDAAIGHVLDHQRRIEADLGALRALSDSTNAAATGIDRLLRTWYVTVARCSSPLVAGVPSGELPTAILTGRVPLTLVAADILSRVHLFLSTAETTVAALDDILHTLNRATEGLDGDAYQTGDRGRGRLDVNPAKAQSTLIVIPEAPAGEERPGAHAPVGPGAHAPAGPEAHARSGEQPDHTGENPPRSGRQSESVDVPLTLPRPDQPATSTQGPQSVPGPPADQPPPGGDGPRADQPLSQVPESDSAADLALAGDQ